MRIAPIWCGLAAFGSGLILCAVAAGSAPWLAVILLLIALGEFAWGAVTLHAEAVRAPRVAMAVSAVVLVAATVLLLTREIGIIPFLALFALHWSAALAAAVAHRRRPADGEARRMRPSRFVMALTLQAMVVAALTTPALAATEPGEFAVPHGVHQHH